MLHLCNDMHMHADQPAVISIWTGGPCLCCSNAVTKLTGDLLADNATCRPGMEQLVPVSNKIAKGPCLSASLAIVYSEVPFSLQISCHQYLQLAVPILHLCKIQ